jgi:hypothetical protein
MAKRTMAAAVFGWVRSAKPDIKQVHHENISPKLLRRCRFSVGFDSVPV